MGSLKNILEKYKLEKWFQRDNLIVLVLAGILLVVIALPTGEPEKKKEAVTVEKAEESSKMQKEENVSEYYGELYEYTNYLESRLEDTLGQMKGVGKVSVMITLEASEKQIVEKEESMSRNNTSENDAEGGSRNVYDIDTKEQTVYTKTDTTQMPYVSQTILPEISGVVIVAQGAEAAGVKMNIVEIAQALFDIEVHKISVVSMNEKMDG